MNVTERDSIYLYCAICGSEMVYKEKKHLYQCPNRQKVKCDEKYIPAPCACQVCGAPLSYGNFKGIKRFFCINRDCPSYAVRFAPPQELPSSKEPEEVAKVDYNGIYSFVFGLRSHKLYYINNFFNIDQGHMKLWISKANCDLEQYSAHYNLLIDRLNSALKYFFDIPYESRPSLLNDCFGLAKDDRYMVIQFAGKGIELVPDLIYAERWHITLSPVMAAIADRNSRLLEELLKNGANVEEISHNKLTPMEWAAYRNNPTAIKLLLKYGADINAKGKDENTPLLAAAYAKSFDALKYLLERGAKVHIGSDIGETALMRVAAKNSVESIIARIP